MLFAPGIEEPCKLKLCNGFTIEIDYVDNGDFDVMIENYRGSVRRIRVYDTNHILISEMIEDNPMGEQERERVQNILNERVDEFPRVIPNGDYKILF